MTEKIIELENRIISLEKRISKLENKKNVNLDNSEFEQKIIQTIHEIGIQHLILLSLKIKPKQTKNDLIAQLEKWGKSLGTWFRGGNFNNRLIKKQLVIKELKSKNEQDIFSLSMKGNTLVKKLIKKYNLE